LRGRIIVLFDLQTLSLTTSPDVVGRVLIGYSPRPAPCTDPDIIATCGNHLDGAGQFDLHPESPEHSVLVGDITAGQLSLGPDRDHPYASRGAVSIRLDISDTAAPITFNLIGARLMAATGSSSSDGLANGRLGGAITHEELNTNVLPGIVRLMAETTAEDCMGSPPACCDPGSSGETLIDLFDDCSDGSLTCDCRVALEELQRNDLISSLLSPDVDLLDETGDFNPRTDEVKESLSLGPGFTTVGAAFELP
jgi:hypothetical protein